MTILASFGEVVTVVLFDVLLVCMIAVFVLLIVAAIRGKV